VFTVGGMADPFGETKKRLLLSKWQAYQEAGEYARDDSAYGVLTDVKYWLHDGLVMHRLVSDPRQLLRKIEDVLG
jgi:hypothetical protein